MEMIRGNQMFSFSRERQVGLAMFLTLLTLLGPASGQARAKDNDPPAKVKLRVEITGVSGDGVGGSIDAFGSDQLLTLTESDPGGGTGKATFGPLVITKDVDSATPKLFLRAAAGVHMGMVKINWVRKNPLTGLEEVYFSVLLEDVVITSHRTRLPDQREPQALQGGAVEDVAFSFAQVHLAFLRPDGTVVSSGFNAKTG